MISSPWTWVLIVGVLLLAFSAGALTSSLLNRKKLRDLGFKIDHTNKNVKLVAVAMERFDPGVIQKAKDNMEQGKPPLADK